MEECGGVSRVWHSAMSMAGVAEYGGCGGVCCSVTSLAKCGRMWRVWRMLWNVSEYDECGRV